MILLAIQLGLLGPSSTTGMADAPLVPFHLCCPRVTQRFKLAPDSLGTRFSQLHLSASITGITAIGQCLGALGSEAPSGPGGSVKYFKGRGAEMEGLERVKNGRDANFTVGNPDPLSVSICFHAIPADFSLRQEHNRGQTEQDDPHSLWGDVESNNNLG